MVTWTIRAIQVGSITLDRSAMTHYKGKGEIITVPIWSAGATDGIHKVLVDTGIRDLEEYKKAEPGVQQTPEQETVTAVKRIMGWNPEDVDFIINTHLHCDHSGSNSKFTNAKCFVQKREWEEAFNPIKPEKPFYDQKCYNKESISYFRWEFLNGDTELLPGLRIITTPGHTFGHQSVLFDIGNGKVTCVSGDICNVAENVNENLEPNIVVDVPATYKSFEKIRQVAHYILPGHDPGITDGAEQFIPII